MGLNKNNNSRIIYRMAKNNLTAKKTSSLIAMLSIFLATALVAVVALFIIGTQTAEQNILDNMQQVMYMNVTEDQAEKLGTDKRVEVSVPYKHCEKEFQVDGVKYSFSYHDSHAENMDEWTHVPVEGKAPDKYNEIVVDKAFMKALGKECILGASVFLDVDGSTEEFTVSGYTDDEYSMLTHPVRVSGAFANQSAVMKDLYYMALVRLNDITEVPPSVFTTTTYQIAADYGIDRSDVNINGKFEVSLQDGNSGLYIIMLVALLLSFAGGLVIYSIFYLSVTSRVQQIGQFQTIGMTEKQIKKMIRREGFFLSVVAIPAGLLIGGFIAYMLLPDGWSFKNYGGVALAVSVLGFLIVQISVSKPASIASKISPIEAAKNVSLDRKENTNRPHKVLNPFNLAFGESRNNQKKWRLTTVSLALGGIVFMMATTWIESWDEEAFSRQNRFKNSEYDIGYLYGHDSPKAYGTTDMQLTGHLGKELEEDIRKIPHVKDIHIEREATGVIEYQGATFNQPFCLLTKEDTEYFQLPAEGNNTYEYMVENDAILISDASFIENLNGITFKPGEPLTIRYFDGEEHTIDLEIGAVSEKSVTTDYQSSTICMSDVTMKKLWKNMNTAVRFFVSAEDYETNGSQVEEDIRALVNQYEDLSLSTLREVKLEDAGLIQEMKIQIYGISIFIILFSIFNLINTTIGSITSRKKELSMLESIGMEERQVRNMLFAESFLLALPNILITLTLGTAAGFGFISFMQKSATYLEYQFPVILVILYIIGMTGIPMLISLCCLKSQNKTSLVERIRDEES